MSSTPLSDQTRDAFREVLAECRRIYVEAGQLMVSQHPQLVPRSKTPFVSLMDDLHRGLLIKTYVVISEADRRWSAAERQLGQELFLHAWGRWVEEPELRETAARVFEHAASLKWYGLVRPFAQLPPLRDFIGPLETVFLRMANLVAKIDGPPGPNELRRLKHLQQEFDCHLRGLDLGLEPAPTPGRVDRPPHQEISPQVVRKIGRDAAAVRRECELGEPVVPAELVEQPEKSLEDVLAELDQLIGMEAVKSEIRSLTNFLQLQQRRREMGLPEVPLSLHLVFTGNPGTGKTTVARIVGQILGAMKILRSGHLVETDRSGLVAEYAGQTGPKTNRKIDEALDGVLFIDEAYSLVGEGGEDAFGAEAVQALLKRMEDDRERLVVILAGYPEPIQRLLNSNPGLSSRFHRRIDFADYTPVELAQIFQRICSRNHYEIPTDVRARLLVGFDWLYRNRDEHFGNGRTVRNLFEDAIRRLADRIAGTAPVTSELLTHLRPTDIQFAEVPSENLDGGPERVRFAIVCPGCQRARRVPGRYLGRQVTCRRCATRFLPEWGEPEWGEPQGG